MRCYDLSVFERLPLAAITESTNNKTNLSVSFAQDITPTVTRGQVVDHGSLLSLDVRWWTMGIPAVPRSPVVDHGSSRLSLDVRWWTMGSPLLLEIR